MEEVSLKAVEVDSLQSFDDTNTPVNIYITVDRTDVGSVPTRRNQRKKTKRRSHASPVLTLFRDCLEEFPLQLDPNWSFLGSPRCKLFLLEVFLATLLIIRAAVNNYPYPVVKFCIATGSLVNISAILRTICNVLEVQCFSSNAVLRAVEVLADIILFILQFVTFIVASASWDFYSGKAMIVILSILQCFVIFASIMFIALEYKKQKDGKLSSSKTGGNSVRRRKVRKEKVKYKRLSTHHRTGTRRTAEHPSPHGNQVNR